MRNECTDHPSSELKTDMSILTGARFNNHEGLLDLDTPADDTKGGMCPDKWLLCFTKVATIPWPKHMNNQGDPPDSDTLSDNLKGRT
jgi:hypothetical protein